MYLIILLIYLVIDYVGASWMEDAAKDKGYGSEYSIKSKCFWLGPLGYMYALSLPDKKVQLQNQHIIDELKAISQKLDERPKETTAAPKAAAPKVETPKVTAPKTEDRKLLDNYVPVQAAAPAMKQEVPAAQPESALDKELKEYKELLKSGVITQKEYDEIVAGLKH